MRVLVVGGCGFIGSNIVHELQFAGMDVWTIDNISTYHNTLDIDLLWRAVAARTKGFKHDNINKCITDNLDHEFNEIKPDVVINLAAYPSVNLVDKYPKEALNIMGAGQLNLLELSKQHGVKKYIYFSSSMVYGNWTRSKMSEWNKPNPINLYGQYKLFGEQLGDMYPDFPVISVRPSAVYGFGDYSHRVLNQFCLNAIQGKPLIIKGRHTAMDFTHVSQVSRAIHFLINLTYIPKLVNSRACFNIAGGCSYDLMTIAHILETISGKHLEIIVEDKEKNHPRRGTLDTVRAQNVLGWHHELSIEPGLEGLYDWINKFYGQQTTISEPKI